MDQGSNKNHSPAYNFTPTVTKFCVMWEGLSLPHDTKFGNCRCKIVDSRSFHSWSLIHGLRWTGLIKVGPGHHKKGIVHGLPTLPLHLNFKNEILLKWVPIGRSDWIHPSGYNVITRNSPVISSKYILSFCVFHYQELHFDRQLIHWGSRMIYSLLLVTPYGNIGRGQH